MKNNHIACEYKDNKALIATISIYVLFGFIILYPAFLILCSVCGYRFEVTYPTFYCAGGVVIAIATVVLNIIFKKHVKSDKALLLCSLSPFFALISTAIFGFNYCTLTAMICMLLIAICCCSLAVTHVKDAKGKILTIIIFLLTFVITLFFLVICLFAGNIGENTVLKTVDSPDGSQYAQIISIDQGALGGNTVVDVHKNKKPIKLLIFKISKKPQRVYIGEWGEFKDMEVHFKSDDCLVINSIEYEIK